MKMSIRNKQLMLIKMTAQKAVIFLLLYNQIITFAYCFLIAIYYSLFTCS